MNIKNKAFKIIPIFLYAIVAVSLAYIILEIVYADKGDAWYFILSGYPEGLPYPEWRGFGKYGGYIIVFSLWLQSWLMLYGIGRLTGKQYVSFNDCSDFKSFLLPLVLPIIQAFLEFVFAWIILCIVKGSA